LGIREGSGYWGASILAQMVNQKSLNALHGTPHMDFKFHKTLLGSKEAGLPCLLSDRYRSDSRGNSAFRHWSGTCQRRSKRVRPDSLRCRRVSARRATHAAVSAPLTGRRSGSCVKLYHRKSKQALEWAWCGGTCAAPTSSQKSFHDAGEYTSSRESTRYSRLFSRSRNGLHAHHYDHGGAN
jgi:hypothetical protein